MNKSEYDFLNGCSQEDLKNILKVVKNKKNYIIEFEKEVEQKKIEKEKSNKSSVNKILEKINEFYHYSNEMNELLEIDVNISFEKDIFKNTKNTNEIKKNISKNINIDCIEDLLRDNFVVKIQNNKTLNNLINDFYLYDLFLIFNNNIISKELKYDINKINNFLATTFKQSYNVDYSNRFLNYFLKGNLKNNYINIVGNIDYCDLEYLKNLESYIEDNFKNFELDAEINNKLDIIKNKLNLEFEMLFNKWNSLINQFSFEFKIKSKIEKLEFKSFLYEIYFNNLDSMLNVNYNIEFKNHLSVSKNIKIDVENLFNELKDNLFYSMNPAFNKKYKYLINYLKEQKIRDVFNSYNNFLSFFNF